MYYQPNLKDIRYMASLQGDFDWPTGEIREQDGAYFFSGDGYEWKSEITAHKSGVFKRVDRVKNVSDRVIELRTALSRFSFPGGEYEVYTQYNEWCGEGYGAWHPLVTEISSEGESVRNNSGASPFAALFSRQTGRGMAFHVVADSLWTIKVKRFFKSAVDKTVEIELGMLSRGLNYRLMPGEELELPTVLFYEFSNKTDLDAYRLHRYLNDVFPARELPIIYNSWLSQFDNISFDILSVQLEKAKQLGAEYFVIDAGWFGPPRTWSQTVGDWEEYTEASMCGRMQEFAEKVRACGLRFGLWFEPERATVYAKAPTVHPEYYLFENNNYFLDFSNEEAVEYIYGEVVRNIRKYGIEFIKFDFNAELTYDRKGEAFHAYFKGYRRFIARLREEFPSLYLENCASGGERMSIANLEGFGSFWASDNHSVQRQVQMYKGNILHMPSRALEKWITVQSLRDFHPVYSPAYADPILSCGEAAWRTLEEVSPDYLFAGMMGGPIGFSCDLTRISEARFSQLRDYVAAYKEDRAFWMDSECRILCDTDRILVLQFNDAAFSQIKLALFATLPMQYELDVYPVAPLGSTYEDGEGKLHTAGDLAEKGIRLPVDFIKRSASLTLKKK